jgi:hypothetical protein
LFAAVHLAESLFEVGLGHEARGKVATDDAVVDFGEEIFDVGIELVEIGDDRDVGFAGPGGGENGGFGVVAVKVESAGVDDPLAIEVGGMEGETVVAAAEDGALALGVDEDEGLGAGGAGNGDDAGVDAGASVREGFAVESGGEVVAEFADVTGAEAPVLAGNDRCGNLSAGEGADGGVFGLGAARGVGGERNYGVCCVEANADKVDLRHFRHESNVNEL